MATNRVTDNHDDIWIFSTSDVMNVCREAMNLMNSGSVKSFRLMISPLYLTMYTDLSIWNEGVLKWERVQSQELEENLQRAILVFALLEVKYSHSLQNLLLITAK